MVLSCKNVAKSFGADEILTDVSFIVEEREKCAIVGINGAGKTTLLKILADELEKDAGEISFKKDLTVSYMPQEKNVESGRALYDETLTVFDDLIKLEERIRAHEGRMAAGDHSAALMDRYHRDSLAFEEKNGYEYRSRVRGVLIGLGFTADDFYKNVSSLSGGEKTRVALGKMLLSQPGLLLLDEPTNHLDIESVGWLENYLLNYPGAVVIVSHDRYFLDKVVTKVVEIEHKKSAVYEGNYSDFAVQKEINREIALKHYVNQQKEIKRQEEVIRVLRMYNTEKSVKRARSREKFLAKMERVDRPENLPDNMRLKLTPRIKSGNDVLSVVELSKSYGGRLLFKDVSIEIKSGEKAALIGPNGIGKTTVLNIIQGLVRPDSGAVRLGVNVTVGYYDQENVRLDRNKTVYDEIYDAYPGLTTTEVRNAMAAFVFTGDDVFKQISALSGGEAGRVALAKIMLGSANFLLLDEPTNHLDMYSKEILENALNNYTGTVLYVSHDRYFINSTADKVLELTETGVTTYLGNYDYYLEKKAGRQGEAETAAVNAPFGERHTADAGDKSGEDDPPYRNDKAAWLTRKEQEAARRRRENALYKTETDINETEGRLRELNELLSADDVAADAERVNIVYADKLAAEEQLRQLYEKWDCLHQAPPESEDGT